MATRASSPNWLLSLSLYLVALFLNHVILMGGAGRVTSNSVLSPYPHPTGPQDALLQRRLLNNMGREVIPPTSPNAIPGEPSCQELRAMWRYYKRQSRAEYTNEIPRLGANPFWDVLPGQAHNPHISSFASTKGRSRARLKLKNSRNGIYGKMLYRIEKDKTRTKPPRPMEQVAQMMGKGTEGKQRGPAPEAIVHFSPPTTVVPTTPTSLQQIKEVFREERIREKAPVMQQANNNPQMNAQSTENGKTFGRIILGPSRGDGRVANKPREFMTPFEKIRFGHADDLLEDGSKPNMNLMAKRRTLPLHFMSRQNRQPRFEPVVMEDDGDSVWMDGGFGELNNVEEVEEEGDSVPDPGFRMYDGNWGSFSVNPSPQENLVLVEMQQPQKFPNFKTSSPVSKLIPSMMDNPTCPEVEGQPCQTNVDCSCVGFGLYRCYINQCQTLSFSSPPQANPVEKVESDTSSMWHTGPVDTSKLGLWEGSPAANNNPVLENADMMMTSSSGFDDQLKTASENQNIETRAAGVAQTPVANSDEKNNGP